jgi:D-glycero-D-manno-heptose 1,7-bisphosphate phosphatase
VFLDRDGTLIEERGYAATPDQVALLPGAAQAVARLNRAGVAAIVITNQSGIGRGYFTQTAVDAQHQRLRELLAAGGARLDAVYVCPHHPDHGCDCRKPRTGMLERAAEELDIDLGRSWVIGDRSADVECGRQGAAGGLLVRTGYGQQYLDDQPARTATLEVFDTVLEAVVEVLARLAADQ